MFALLKDLRFIAGPNGYEPVQLAPEPRETHPVRLVLASTKNGDPDPLREGAYKDVEAANTDLEYQGQFYEDISLISCEGGRPEDFGF